MPWWTWIALGFFVAMLVIGAVYALLVIRSLEVLEATSERIATALEELTVKSEALERRNEEVQARREAALAHFEHLNATLERFSVLTWALGDVARTVSGLRAALLVRK